MLFLLRIIFCYVLFLLRIIFCYYIKVDEFRCDRFYMDFVYTLISLYGHILKSNQAVSFFNRIPSIAYNISGLYFLAFRCIS